MKLVTNTPLTLLWQNSDSKTPFGNGDNIIVVLRIAIQDQKLQHHSDTIVFVHSIYDPHWNGDIPLFFRAPFGYILKDEKLMWLCLCALKWRNSLQIHYSTMFYMYDNNHGYVKGLQVLFFKRCYFKNRNRKQGEKDFDTISGFLTKICS